MLIKIENRTLSTDEPISIAALTNELLNAIAAGFHQVVQAQVSEGAEEMKVKEDLYDMFNDMASEFLAHWIPDKDLRPDLTAQAILEMENKILNDMSDKRKEYVNLNALTPEIILEKDED